MLWNMRGTFVTLTLFQLNLDQISYNISSSVTEIKIFKLSKTVKSVAEHRPSLVLQLEN